MTYYSVVIIGGGATGVGILRDLSMRGISALLLEQGDLAHGTSSRFHGLLHSGGRYAVKDPESAIECINENITLKKIASHCISDTGGWFVQTIHDPPEYVEQWVEACNNAHIPIREISLSEAHLKEPLLSKGAIKVFEVPDAIIDGFKIIWANAKSASRYGGRYKTYHQVQRLIVKNNRITGLVAKNILNGEELEISCDIVVNASGPWASNVAGSINVPLKVICDKGTLLAFNHRLCERVINRLRPSGDGDIFVPHETITILGTTSKHVASPDDSCPEKEEVKKLLRLGGQLIPGLNNFRVIRAFSGVRPLFGADYENPGSSKNTGRNISRSFTLIDHESQNGVEGFVSIAGGKFTTYRLMAEKVTDWVAKKLGNSAPCRTAEETLMPEIPAELWEKASLLLPNAPIKKMLERLGEDAESVLTEIERNPYKSQMLCECEMVSLAEVEKVASDVNVNNLSDIRRKTRLGMGTCQGTFCTYRALPLLLQHKEKYYSVNDELINFLNRRWKGIRPVLWGQQLRETELTRAIYSNILQIKAN